jgi:hypothetical protein
VIRLTDRAAAALMASQTAARRFDPDARLRLARAGRELRAELVEEPSPGDGFLEVDGLQLLVEPGITGTVDAGEHNALVLLQP